MASISPVSLTLALALLLDPFLTLAPALTGRGRGAADDRDAVAHGKHDLV